MDQTALPRPAELAALLSAKLCHDLISPTSAIVSGIDLLEDDSAKDMHDDALALVISSSKKLGALLQFCRVAFGASASADTFGSSDLNTLAKGYFETQKAELDWAVANDSVSKPAARTLMNLVLIGAGALPRGGTARLEADEASVTLTATGPRANLRAEVARGLAGEALGEGLAGHWVQAYYLSLIVADAGGSISHDLAEENVLVRVSLPA